MPTYRLSQHSMDVIFKLEARQHQRARQEVITESLALARQLPERQQRQALAALIGLGHRFLTDAELDTLLEGPMSTNWGQRLIDRGAAQTRQQDVLLVL